MGVWTKTEGKKNEWWGEQKTQIVLPSVLRVGHVNMKSLH